MHISPYVINAMFMLTFYMSIYQHVKLEHPNPITNRQFFMMVFSLLMVIVVALYNRTNPWLSTAFLAIAAVCLITAYRQFRYLPPVRKWD